MLHRLCDFGDAIPASDAMASGPGLVPEPQFQELMGRTLASQNGPPAGRVPFAVFYVDLDGPELVTTGLTESVVDQVRVEIGRRLARWAGPTGAATCRGFDHFVVLRLGTSPGADDIDASERIVEELRRSVARPMVVAGRRIRIAAHVGIVVVSRPNPFG